MEKMKAEINEKKDKTINESKKVANKIIDEKQVDEIKNEAKKKIEETKEITKEKAEKIKNRLEEEADKQNGFTILGFKIWRILAYFVIYSFLFRNCIWTFN